MGTAVVGQVALDVDAAAPVVAVAIEIAATGADATETASSAGVAEGSGVAEGAAPSTPPPPRRAFSRLAPIAGTPPSLPASPRTVNI